MTRSTLYWLIFTCLTLALLGAATLQGFLRTLWEQDVTFLSLALVAGYLLATMTLGWSIYAGRKHGRALWYVCDVFERCGIVGTFVGLLLAFQSLRDMDAAGEWRHHLLEGVSTKFLCSIVGILAAMFLRTQLRILGVREE